MEIRDLLSKPVWQMTGEEFIFLNRHALQGSGTKPAQPAADKDYQQEKVAPFYARNFDDTAGKATQNVVHFAKELLHIPTDHLPL